MPCYKFSTELSCTLNGSRGVESKEIKIKQEVSYSIWSITVLYLAICNSWEKRWKCDCHYSWTWQTNNFKSRQKLNMDNLS